MNDAASRLLIHHSTRCARHPNTAPVPRLLLLLLLVVVLVMTSRETDVLLSRGAMTRRRAASCLVADPCVTVTSRASSSDVISFSLSRMVRNYLAADWPG